jgi:hypothetical protein
MLDGVACRVAGHIWVPQVEVEGVLLCARCGARDDSEARRRWGRPRRRQPKDKPPLIPENRPWLEAPFTRSE